RRARPRAPAGARRSLAARGARRRGGGGGLARPGAGDEPCPSCDRARQGQGGDGRTARGGAGGAGERPGLGRPRALVRRARRTRAGRYALADCAGVGTDAVAGAPAIIEAGTLVATFGGAVRGSV